MGRVNPDRPTRLTTLSFSTAFGDATLFKGPVGFKTANKILSIGTSEENQLPAPLVPISSVWEMTNERVIKSSYICKNV